jgi:glycerol-3-phosphate dehydrogenase
MPLVKGGTYGKLASSVGLEVYDILANVRKQDRRHMLGREETLELEPLLNAELLVGSGFYSEYRTDDARLTIEIIKCAVRKGALCLNYCELIGINHTPGRITGVDCLERLGGKHLEIRVKHIINAGGPWVDHIRNMNDSIGKKRLHLTKGVHLVVPHHKLPVRHSVYFDVPGGRMIFTIPRGRTTYIGTTDTDYRGSLDKVLTGREDADYLLNAVNSTFPGISLTLSDVESSWAGIRPLIHQEGKSASEISRKDEIFEAKDGLISIAGGKLTGYRRMAQKAVDLVIERFERETGYQLGPCITRHIPLAEDPLWNQEEVAHFTGRIARETESRQLNEYTAGYLVSNYGKQCRSILDSMERFPESDPGQALCRAELRFCTENEFVRKSIDFFDRRTGRLSFDIDSVRIMREIINDDLAHLLGWSSEEKEADRAQLDERIREVSTFD